MSRSSSGCIGHKQEKWWRACSKQENYEENDRERRPRERRLHGRISRERMSKETTPVVTAMPCVDTSIGSASALRPPIFVTSSPEDIKDHMKQTGVTRAQIS